MPREKHKINIIKYSIIQKEKILIKQMWSGKVLKLIYNEKDMKIVNIR